MRTSWGTAKSTSWGGGTDDSENDDFVTTKGAFQGTQNATSSETQNTTSWGTPNTTSWATQSKTSSETQSKTSWGTSIKGTWRTIHTQDSSTYQNPYQIQKNAGSLNTKITDILVNEFKQYKI